MEPERFATCPVDKRPCPCGCLVSNGCIRSLSETSPLLPITNGEEFTETLRAVGYNSQWYWYLDKDNRLRAKRRKWVFFKSKETYCPINVVHEMTTGIKHSGNTSQAWAQGEKLGMSHELADNIVLASDDNAKIGITKRRQQDIHFIRRRMVHTVGLALPYATLPA